MIVFKSNICFKKAALNSKINCTRLLQFIVNILILHVSVMYTGQAMYYNVTLWRVRVTNVCVKKLPVLDITRVCLYPCLNCPACKSHFFYLRDIVLSSVAGLAVPCFFTLSHKRHDFRKQKIVNINCVFAFPLSLCL